MNADYTSSELFHFVGHKSPLDHEANFETLKKVLDSKCITYSPNDLSWGPVRHEVNWDRSLLDESLIIPTITCYADIPKDCLKIHMEKYGYFGLSIDRDYLIKYHVRPVTYIPVYNNDHFGVSGRTLIKDIESVVKGFCYYFLTDSIDKYETSRYLEKMPENSDQAIAALESTLLKDFLAFIKPFNSELPLDHKDNYYMEREWRKLGNIKFSEDVVKSVVIAKGYENSFLKEFPQYENRLSIADTSIPPRP